VVRALYTTGTMPGIAGSNPGWGLRFSVRLQYPVMMGMGYLHSRESKAAGAGRGASQATSPCVPADSFSRLTSLLLLN